MELIPGLKRSVIVAADVDSLGTLLNLAQKTKGILGIGAFKLGFRMAFKNLKHAVDIVKNAHGSETVIIYDHQKAGNDIPAMGKGFAEDLKLAGVDVAILFPFTGPSTQVTWMNSCFSAGLEVMVGGVMTHPEFLESEGGYICDSAPERIYRTACHNGVSHFVVPGNKLDWIRKIRRWIVDELGEGNYTLSAPGFITQKGSISEYCDVAGDNWHAIVGSAIYKAENIREAAFFVTKQIR